MSKLFGQPLGVSPSTTAATTAPSPVGMTQQQKAAAAREGIAESALSVKAPGSASPSLNPTSDTPVMWMGVDDIETYEKNPRHDPNEAYDDIRHAVLTQGVQGVIVVTRIPGRNKYVCAKGANTRLKIIKSLWQELRDPRFERIMVQIVMWRGHAAAITDHIIENTVRGAMSFWDMALACQSIRNEIAAEEGVQPSANKLADMIEAMGKSVDRATLSRYLHTAEHFGAVKSYVDTPVVRVLIPTTNALLRLALKWGLSEAQAWDEMHASLERYAERFASHSDTGDAQSFDAADCAKALEASMAVRLQLTSYQLSFALTALQRAPNAPKDELLTDPEPVDSRMGAGAPASVQDEFGDDAEEPQGSDQIWGGAPERARQTPDGPRHSEATAETIEHEDGRPHGSRPAGTSPEQVALELAKESREGKPSGGTSHASKTLSVDEALDAVITAAADFAEACFVGDWLVTGHALPYGYFMDIRDCVVDQLPLLREPVPGCEDARIRVGGWWMAASLSKQWSVDETLLLPVKSGWRVIWGREHDNVMSTDANNLFSMIQDAMGGVMSDAGEPALQIEYLSAVMQSSDRLLAWHELVQAVQALHRARQGGRTA